MNFKYLSDKFDTQAVSNLSLLFSPAHLTVIAKNSNGEILGSEGTTLESPQTLQEALERSELVQVQTANLWVHNPHFALVPGVVFNPEHISTYLNFSTPLVQQEGFTTFHNSLDSNNLYLAGALENTWADVFRQCFSDLKIGHAGSLILDYLLEKKGDYLDQEVFAVLDHGQMYLAGFSGAALKFFNRFQPQSEEGLLKYIFVAFHQLEFDRNYCKVHIMGDLASVNASEESLKSYFKYLITDAPKSNVNYFPGAEKLKDTQEFGAFWSL